LISHRATLHFFILPSLSFRTGIFIIRRLQKRRQTEPLVEVDDDDDAPLIGFEDTSKNEKNVIFQLLFVYLLLFIEIFVFASVYGSITGNWNGQGNLTNTILSITVLVVLSDLFLVSYVEDRVNLGFLF
jgi:hypothetical protein